ncbi:hypothetical protein E6C27_scaffold115G001190 [Cucumis melo var. makuwa]|uniref:Uncharacterized protein n=1 Tax=Cucumis melo var. makuwa TaxID=1194695 RepID=A0A5A7U0A6_CUCMM|nr:hypothetical protein E6C27_scaffold115G001190 [Cucumis melo var. makuwa]
MTLLAKWIWQFYHEADTLCHNVIISKYGPRPFNWIGGVVKSTSRNPWKDISSEFSLLSQFIQGMGGDTYFWKDKEVMLGTKLAFGVWFSKVLKYLTYRYILTKSFGDVNPSSTRISIFYLSFFFLGSMAVFDLLSLLGEFSSERGMFVFSILVLQEAFLATLSFIARPISPKLMPLSIIDVEDKNIQGGEVLYVADPPCSQASRSHLRSSSIRPF